MECKYAKACGNCQLLDREYKDTIKYKINYINECFKKYNINHKIDEVIDTEYNTQYRNKMIVSFKYQNNKILAGFYEEKSHKVINIDYCLMHSDEQNKIVSSVITIMKDLRIKPYDEDKRIGLFRHLLIKESFVNKDIMVVIITSEEMFPGRNEFIKRLKENHKSIKTIIQNINPRKTSIVLGEKERVLWGNGYIEDIICGLKFKIISKSFFQVNPRQAEKLYLKAIEYGDFNSNDIILDAYSGVGTIGLISSKNIKKVLTVENNKQSVKAAIENTKNNNIKNVWVVEDDATDYINKLVTQKEHIDGIILDPSRNGTTASFIEACRKLNPAKIVYVSCEAETLARDLEVFIKKGYLIKKICAVDMFCWTKVVECVVYLSLKDK